MKHNPSRLNLKWCRRAAFYEFIEEDSEYSNEDDDSQEDYDFDQNSRSQRRLILKRCRFVEMILPKRCRSRLRYGVYRLLLGVNVSGGVVSRVEVGRHGFGSGRARIRIRMRGSVEVEWWWHLRRSGGEWRNVLDCGFNVMVEGVLGTDFERVMMVVDWTSLEEDHLK
ncbi:hypothetical protein Tco_0952891 [Tanacetum coccineum]|uniref:Uncharacterized protein n=1 Tax=Tanacetum coccineum TaxID=301880 RepID=A0ABQ5E172_9ASTR